MSIVPSKALWSDVPLPPRPVAFNAWAHEQGLDPSSLMFRPVLPPSPANLCMVERVEVWSLDHSIHVWLEVNDRTKAALTDVRQVLDDAWLLQGNGADRASLVVEPQSWRVLAHLAHWEQRREDVLTREAERLITPTQMHELSGPIAYQLARTTEAFHRHPLDETQFNHLQTSFLASSHRDGMSMEQYHAWWGRSSAQLGQDGGLSESVHAELLGQIQGPLAQQPADQHQKLVRKIFKPHPMHEVLYDQAVERWHLANAMQPSTVEPSRTERPRL